MTPRGPAPTPGRVLARGRAVVLAGLVAALAVLVPGVGSAQDVTPGSVTLTLDSTVPRRRDLGRAAGARRHRASHQRRRGPGPRRRACGCSAARRSPPTARSGAPSTARCPPTARRAAAPASPRSPGTSTRRATCPFTVRVPLRGPADSSLALTTPGVYPLVVDVNATPGTAGAPARVASAGCCCPSPACPGVPGPPVPAPGRAPAVSVLWPLADRPRRLPVPPGAPHAARRRQPRDLLRPRRAPRRAGGGARPQPPRSAVRPPPSVCLAVDADLLETAADMSGGYQVRTPTGPAPGAGAARGGRVARLGPRRGPGPVRARAALRRRRPARDLPRQHERPHDGGPHAGRAARRGPARHHPRPGRHRAGAADWSTSAAWPTSRAAAPGRSSSTARRWPAGSPRAPSAASPARAGPPRWRWPPTRSPRRPSRPGPRPRDGSTSPAGGGTGLATQDALGVVTLRALRPGPGRRPAPDDRARPAHRMGRRPGRGRCPARRHRRPRPARPRHAPRRRDPARRRGGARTGAAVGGAGLRGPRRPCPTSRRRSSTRSAGCATTSATCSPRAARTTPAHPPRRTTSSR